MAGEGEVCSAVLLNEDKKPEFNSIPSNQEYLKKSLNIKELLNSRHLAQLSSRETDEIYGDLLCITFSIFK